MIFPFSVFILIMVSSSFCLGNTLYVYYSGKQQKVGSVE